MAAIAVAALAVMVYSWRGVVRTFWERRSECSVGDAWRAVKERSALMQRSRALQESARKIESDPAGWERVEIAGRRWWMPERNVAVLPFMVAEQEADVYGGDRAVRKGDVVLDCGANVGVFTRRALDEGARLVVAIELAPENVECLRRNFADEVRAGRVIVYPKGVWDRDDELAIHTYEPDSGGNSVALRFQDSREGPRVPLTTIDRIATELRLDRVDFIKMDIEGAERRALAGARETVARWRPRMAISLEHEPDDYEVISRLVTKQWPGMRQTCGPCRWVRSELVDRVAPEELFVSR
jgi:FkbM family methyltransferase